MGLANFFQVSGFGERTLTPSECDTSQWKMPVLTTVGQKILPSNGIDVASRYGTSGESPQILLTRFLEESKERLQEHPGMYFDGGSIDVINRLLKFIPERKESAHQVMLPLMRKWRGDHPDKAVLSQAIVDQMLPLLDNNPKVLEPGKNGADFTP